MNGRTGKCMDENKPRLRNTGSGRIDSHGNETPKAGDDDMRPTLKHRN